MSCMSVSREDGETAADETEFGCAQGDSTISESETARGGVAELEGETGGVMGEGEGEEGEVEDEVRDERWAAQVFFPLPAAFS